MQRSPHQLRFLPLNYIRARVLPLVVLIIHPERVLHIEHRLQNHREPQLPEHRQYDEINTLECHEKMRDIRGVGVCVGVATVETQETTFGEEVVLGEAALCGGEERMVFWTADEGAMGMIAMAEKSLTE